MKYKFIIITINPDYIPPLVFSKKNTIIFKGISYKEEPQKIKEFFKNEPKDVRKLATLYSHIHAIKYASEQPFAKTHNIIIMEDDVEFNNLCPKNFKKIVKRFNKNEIIQLSIMTQLKSPFWTNFQRVRNWKRNYWSACAYYISFQGMQKIVKHIHNNQMDISQYKSKVADYIIFKICKTKTPQFLPFTYNMRPTTIGSCDNFALQTKFNLKLHSLLHNPKFYVFCKENNINSIYTPTKGNIYNIIKHNSKIPISENSGILLFPTEDFIKTTNHLFYIFYVCNELNFFTDKLLNHKHVFANNYNYENINYNKIKKENKLFINF